MSRRATRVCTLSLSVLALACSSERGATGPTPWSDQRTQIIDEDRSSTRVSPAASDGCIEFEGGQCLKPADKCGREAADLVLGSDGKLLDTLCYPSDANLTVDELAAAQGTIAQPDNNSVVVFDNLDDGADLTGDVVVDANNVILYGDAANTALLAGSLTLDGNNAFVRGLHIQGDVTVNKNNAVLAFCVIEGDLTIHGNNTKLLACDVLGDIIIDANNTALYGNRVAGQLASSGKNSDCKDNFSAADVNLDLRIEAAEVGAALACR